MNDLFPNRRWLVIPTSITGSINWNQVLELNPESLRLSIDQTETFIKYDVNVITASYSQSWYNLETHQSQSILIPSGTYGRPDIYSSEYSEYDYLGILALLDTQKWTSSSIF
jgi:hypothetical protein